jgi:SAM-dependent methyltransferase
MLVTALDRGMPPALRKVGVFSLLAFTTLLIGAAIGWRWASRQRQLPCPSWLAWLLDNPLTEAVAGSQTTLDRIDLQPGEYVLDVGSGPGRLAIPAARRVGPNGRVVATDVQPDMLVRLQKRATAASVTNISPQSLPS